MYTSNLESNGRVGCVSEAITTQVFLHQPVALEHFEQQIVVSLVAPMCAPKGQRSIVVKRAELTDKIRVAMVCMIIASPYFCSALNWMTNWVIYRASGYSELRTEPSFVSRPLILKIEVEWYISHSAVRFRTELAVITEAQLLHCCS